MRLGLKKNFSPSHHRLTTPLSLISPIFVNTSCLTMRSTTKPLNRSVNALCLVISIFYLCWSLIVLSRPALGLPWPTPCNARLSAREDSSLLKVSSMQWLVQLIPPDLTINFLDRPCKIIDMSTSKTGKHGHAKVNLVATDVRRV